MKKIAINFCIIIVLCLSLFDCKKGDITNSPENSDDLTNTTIPVEVVTQYIKNSGYVYQNAEDVNIPIKNLKADSYLKMDFGSKVNVLYEIKIGDDSYYKIQLPDTTEYFALKSLFTEKFIVINKPHVCCYKQPDTDYVPIVKVEPGDFGYFVKELNGWVLVDFYCTYRPYKEGGDRNWVGQYWINTGYTDDIKCAKQAYYLALANNQLYNKKLQNQEQAIDFLQQAMSITNNSETEISYVITDLLRLLAGPEDSTDSNEENIEESTTTTISNLEENYSL